MSILKDIDEVIDSGVEQWADTTDGKFAKIRAGLGHDMCSLIGTQYNSEIIKGTLQCIGDKWARYCKYELGWSAMYEVHDGGILMYVKPAMTIKHYKIDARISEYYERRTF